MTLQNKKINFLRVSDVADLLKKPVETLNSQNILCFDQNNPKTLRLLICGDKGGSSTKILCEFLNCKASHSVKTARLLGIFEGAKDNQENNETIFGPVLEQIERFTIDDPGEIFIKLENSTTT